MYYIRRRYKLYREIKRIPQELLFKESYKNYLKNLTIKCIIHNFIIVILVLEFVQNIGEVIFIIPNWVQETNSKIISIFPFLFTFLNYSDMFFFSMRFSVVPVVSLVMNFLWLAYRKYKYKYMIVRWTVYIVIRSLTVFLGVCIHSFNLLPFDYIVLLVIVSQALKGFFIIFDFIQFVHFSRKFYLHLKSREKEIRLFYNDYTTYLDSKFLRIHYMIATSLVGISLFLFSIGLFINPNELFSYISYFLPIPLHLKYVLIMIFKSLDDYLLLPSLILSKICINLNYLYILFVVVYNSYRDRKKLANINNYIKPIYQTVS